MSSVIELPKTTSLQAIEDAMALAVREENSVILSNVSWNTYKQFVRQTIDKISNPRFYFDKGNLLIMSVSPEHEYYNRLIASLIDILAESFQINWLALGSTTFTDENLKSGFEPDSCFYFENAEQMLRVKRLDMSIHPAPDLIIEVDITSLSTFRQDIYAPYGVREIWRFENNRLEILKLKEEKYSAIDHSPALPKVTPEILTQFIKESEQLARLDWVKKVREWAEKTEPRV